MIQMINFATLKQIIMKNIIITLVLSLTVSFAFGQKKELRAVDKLVSSAAYSEALQQLEGLESLVATSEPKYQTQFHYLLGKTQSGLKAYREAVAAFQKTQNIESVEGMSKYSTEIDGLLTNLSVEIVNQAIADNKNEDFSKASDLLYLAYEIDKDTNIDYLYFAASSSVNGGDFSRALDYYLDLKSLGYTGVTTQYFATDVETREELELTKENYELFQKLKNKYSNFRTQDTESRLPEIIKNIALIYVQEGQNEMAFDAIKEARAVNPTDVGLILTEADLYIKLGDKERFADLMKEAITQDPNNALLYFNLGVINAEQGNREEARSYYERTIELDPAYEATYLNMAALILDGEAAIVDQMNSLGTSRADNIKYDKLKIEREALFLEAVPVLEQLIAINPKHMEALTTLKNIYGTVGDTANFMKIKEKLESLE